MVGTKWSLFDMGAGKILDIQNFEQLKMQGHVIVTHITHHATAAVAW
jgi:hypothetical protein